MRSFSASNLVDIINVCDNDIFSLVLENTVSEISKEIIFEIVEKTKTPNENTRKLFAFTRFDRQEAIFHAKTIEMANFLLEGDSGVSIEVATYLFKNQLYDPATFFIAIDKTKRAQEEFLKDVIPSTAFTNEAMIPLEKSIAGFELTAELLELILSTNPSWFNLDFFLLSRISDSEKKNILRAFFSNNTSNNVMFDSVTRRYILRTQLFRPFIKVLDDETGNTALHLAVINDASISCVQFIMKIMGVNKNIKNVRGETAYEMSAGLVDTKRFIEFNRP
jgi:hypothetical protein